MPSIARARAMHLCGDRDFWRLSQCVIHRNSQPDTHEFPARWRTTHRKHDPEFAKQWDEAREYGIEMLHARAFQRALEGDLEPVYYMGVVVDYVRKFDSNLQIEMLRALKPDKFKTAGANVNVAARGDLFVLTEEARHELMELNRQWLEDHPPPADDSETAPARAEPGE